VVSSFELSVKLEPLRLPLGIRGHLLCLAAIGFLLIGAYHVLDMFDLVRSTEAQRSERATPKSTLNAPRS